MPVLPLEGSSRVAPGASRPAFSASSTICLAMRSLTLPVGFWLSSLAHRRTPGFGDSRGRPTSGVLPIASARSSWRMGLPAFGHPARGTACHRRKDGDHVAVVELGIERAEEADVLVVDVDVHEAVQPTVRCEQLAGDAREARLEVAEEVVFFFQAEDGIRDFHVTGVQTCVLPISSPKTTFGGVITQAQYEPLSAVVPISRSPSKRRRRLPSGSSVWRSGAKWLCRPK